MPTAAPQIAADAYPAPEGSSAPEPENVQAQAGLLAARIADILPSPEAPEATASVFEALASVEAIAPESESASAPSSILKPIAFDAIPTAHHDAAAEAFALAQKIHDLTPEPAEAESFYPDDYAPIEHYAQDKPVSDAGWAARLKQGLAKTRDQLGKSLAGVFGGGQIDEELYEDLETVLLTSDMGIEATQHLLKDVRRRVSLRGLKDAAELRLALKESLYDLIVPLEKPLVLAFAPRPFVMMMTGVNGAGKTTSIGKLAHYYQTHGMSVLLAAGDTFRAAAREQLIEWGQRNQVNVISQASGDSAAVCFDAVEAAKARKIEIVLADTAGRLPTQLHLMEEIKKVKRVLQKSIAEAPHEIILVLDANIGQNAINQVKAFDDALGLTGLVLTKLDGTAKGGVIAALAKVRPIPIRYIGVGEGMDDLRPFNARDYVDALFGD